jgi:hypothetical protein
MLVVFGGIWFLTTIKQLPDSFMTGTDSMDGLRRDDGSGMNRSRWESVVTDAAFPRVSFFPLGSTAILKVGSPPTEKKPKY